jgi:hypothetical protein
MTQQPTSTSGSIEALGYAATHLNRRTPLVTTVAIVSICVAGLSLAINCIFENAAVSAMQQVVCAPAQMHQTMAARSQRIAAAMRTASSQPAMRALTPAEISQVIVYINKLLGAESGGLALSDAQKKTVAKLLSQQGQQLIDPDTPLGSQTPGKLQMIRAWPSSDHSVLLAVNHGSALRVYRMRIDAAGHQSAFPSIPRPNFSPSPFLAGTAPAPLTLQNQQIIQGQYISALISAIVFGINAILNIPLLAAGVYLLKSNRRGVQLLWIYVAIKLPLAVVTGTNFLTNYFATQMPLHFPLGTSLTFVGCLYPISLLIILRSRTFRSTAYDAAGDSKAFAIHDSRPAWFSAIGMISLCIGCLSLLAGGFYEYGAFGAISQASQDRQTEEQELRMDAARAVSAARAAAAQPPPRALRQDEISYLISTISSQLRVRGGPGYLTSAQGETLTRLLSAPGQHLFDPDIPLGVPPGIDKYQNFRVSLDNAGVLNLSTNIGSHSSSWYSGYVLKLDPSGKELHAEQVVAPPPAVAVNLSSDQARTFDRNHQSAVLAAILFALDLAPAFLLFIGAYQLLKSNPRGIATHRLYAVLKLITALLGAYAVCAMLDDTLGEMILPFALAPSLLALIYPIALLIVLRNENVRMQLIEPTA